MSRPAELCTRTDLAKLSTADLLVIALQEMWTVLQQREDAADLELQTAVLRKSAASLDPCDITPQQFRKIRHNCRSLARLLAHRCHTTNVLINVLNTTTRCADELRGFEPKDTER